MNKTLLLIIAVLALATTWLLRDPSPAIEDRFVVGDLLGGVADEGFSRAMEPREFRFPQDHGPHPDFRNEWWYFTGNLKTGESRRFGYQIVFFRNALTPAARKGDSDWGSNQTWMAHFAITDAANDNFQAFERFSRGGKQLAGANSKPFQVWLYDWSIQEEDGVWNLRARAGDIELDLNLEALRAPLLQGQDGLSQKSSEPGNASYYYSIPRLGTKGTISIGKDKQAVSGTSWLDREWSTSALGKDQEGWDWFSLQLSDGTDLMFYRLRKKDGTADPFSSGTLVQSNGKIIRLKKQDVELKPLKWWKSPLGGSYPIGWELAIPSQNINLTVSPVIEHQELDLLVRYWEGAVDVTGSNSGKKITGQGYLELAGYADQARDN